METCQLCKHKRDRHKLVSDLKESVCWDCLWKGDDANEYLDAFHEFYNALG